MVNQLLLSGNLIKFLLKRLFKNREHFICWLTLSGLFFFFSLYLSLYKDIFEYFFLLLTPLVFLDLSKKRFYGKSSDLFFGLFIGLLLGMIATKIFSYELRPLPIGFLILGLMVIYCIIPQKITIMNKRDYIELILLRFLAFSKNQSFIFIISFSILYLASETYFLSELIERDFLLLELFVLLGPMMVNFLINRTKKIHTGLYFFFFVFLYFITFSYFISHGPEIISTQTISNHLKSLLPSFEYQGGMGLFIVVSVFFVAKVNDSWLSLGGILLGFGTTYMVGESYKLFPAGNFTLMITAATLILFLIFQKDLGSALQPQLVGLQPSVRHKNVQLSKLIGSIVTVLFCWALGSKQLTGIFPCIMGLWIICALSFYKIFRYLKKNNQ